MMSNLRFIERDGKMVLETRKDGWNHSLDEKTGDIISFYNPKLETEWTPVPTHQEPKKVTLVDEVADIIENKSPIQPRYKAMAVIEFFKKRISGLPATQALRQCEQALFGEA
jgi:hypothetical protein